MPVSAGATGAAGGGFGVTFSGLSPFQKIARGLVLRQRQEAV
jgi:hypothetical protein